MFQNSKNVLIAGGQLTEVNNNHHHGRFGACAPWLLVKLIA